MYTYIFKKKKKELKLINGTLVVDAIFTWCIKHSETRIRIRETSINYMWYMKLGFN